MNSNALLFENHIHRDETGPLYGRAGTIIWSFPAIVHRPGKERKDFASIIKYTFKASRLRNS
jgi:hypothetical protein